MVLVGFIFNLETPDTGGGGAQGKKVKEEGGSRTEEDSVPEVWTEPDQKTGVIGKPVW